MNIPLRFIIFSCFIHSISILNGQNKETISWKGVIINETNRESVANAVIAVFSQISLYSADEKGFFSIELQPDDSVKIVAMGFQTAIFYVNKLHPNSEGISILELKQFSYKLKEVTIKGYSGILDPLIFPKLEDDSPQMELNMPSDIGSKISKLPPNERPLIGKPNPLMLLVNPVSFGYSLFSKHEKSLKNLTKARIMAKEWELKDNLASKETIAIISCFKGDELEKFIIYCNQNLKLTPFDNGASAASKISELLNKYKK